MSFSIRKYISEDREAVRQIAFDTALAGKSGSIFFDGEDFLKDALTLYFTEYEPESVWVAVKDEVVVGYIMGAKDEAVLRSVHITKILPHMFVELLRSGILFSKKNWKVLTGLLKGFLQGEFKAPSLADDYPAVLHINLNPDARGQGVGALLINALLDSFVAQKIKGVRLATMSAYARDFFLRNGFTLLYEGHRSYLQDVLGENMPLYVLGRHLDRSSS